MSMTLIFINFNKNNISTTFILNATIQLNWTRSSRDRYCPTIVEEKIKVNIIVQFCALVRHTSDFVETQARWFWWPPISTVVSDCRSLAFVWAPIKLLPVGGAVQQYHSTSWTVSRQYRHNTGQLYFCT